MTTRVLITTAVTALALIGAPVAAQTAAQNKTSTAPGGSAAGTKMAPMSASQFAQMMAASDQFEIMSSKTALEKSTRQEVKDFANMMIKQHMDSSQKLTALASQMKPPLTIGKQLDPEQRQMTTDLQKMPAGNSFDRAYLDAQVTGHARTLAMLQSYADTGKVDQLRNFAKQMIPIVSGHLDQARKLQATVSAQR